MGASQIGYQQGEEVEGGRNGGGMKTSDSMQEQTGITAGINGKR